MNPGLLEAAGQLLAGVVLPRSVPLKISENRPERLAKKIPADPAVRKLPITHTKDLQHP